MADLCRSLTNLRNASAWACGNTPAATAASRSSRSMVKLLHRHVAVGVDANVGGDIERLAHDRFGIKRPVEQGACGGERVTAARADAGDAGFRLQYVAIAGENQRSFLVGDDHHRFEPAQITVGAPVLGQFDRRTQQLPRILVELGFQPLEQGERVGGGAGKAADHVALAETAHLLGIGLDDGLLDRDLAVAADRHHAALADGQDGRAMPKGSVFG